MEKDARIKLRIVSFVVISIGSVYLLYWAVDCLPLSIFGKLMVSGAVSLIFLFAGVWLLIVDWKRKVIEEYMSEGEKRQQRSKVIRVLS